MVPQQSFLGALVLFLLFQLSTSADTVTAARSIADGEILLSNQQNFALGFFSPGNSNNRYLGIWYNKVPEQTVVWVANRDSPIQNSTGVLKINGDRNLVVVVGDRKTPLWSTNVSTAIDNSTAKLFDSGNLVLSSSLGGTILWQSFDHPTHMFLPGMKLGLSLKTGLKWSLTSWKSRDDPARGDYSFSLDPRGSPQFFLNKGLAPRWRTGPWNGHGLSGVPVMTQSYIFSYRFVSNDDEIYMMYLVHNSSMFSTFLLDEAGSVKRQTWLGGSNRWNVFWSTPRDICDDYGRCGAFGSCNPDNNLECQCLPGFDPKSSREWYLRDWSGGCARNRSSECGKGEGFLKLVHVKVPDTSVARVDMRSSLMDCEKECLRNCSCTGYTSANINGGGSGCVAWYGELMDIREFTDGGQDFYVRVDAAELAAAAQAKSEPKGFRGKKRMVVILVVSLVVGIFFLVLCGYYVLKKKKTEGTMGRRSHGRPLFDLMSRSNTAFKESMELEDNGTNPELPFFELNVIVAATDNFSSSNKLGQGGFGSVYKGQLSNGREIAVKRLSKNSGQGIEEFKNEVMLIAKLQHRNLVRLLGCCVQEEEKMLIYEYMPNKSLDNFIFDKSRRALLDWRKRFEIIVGIARGILYLHQDSRLKIIHRDLKASNVLLDAEMIPKISDFGMARIFGGNQSEANTNRVVGTYGYMSPEYAMNGLFSIKSDVFSFGVLLLEIISGKKNNDYYHEDPSMNLIGHAWDLWRESKVGEIIDSSIIDPCLTHEVLRCIHVALLCVQESPLDRPTMSSVVFMLGNETTMPPPNHPAFVVRKTLKDQESSSTGAGSSSVNEVTITVVEGR